MAVHPADSDIFGDLYGAAEMRALFSDARHLHFMLEVEAALARAQARLGLIPAEAAAAIGRAARVEHLDIAALRASTVVVGYPVVALVRALGQAAGPEAARWTHWGATTQDILDSAAMLQVRAGLALIERDLLRTLVGLARLAQRHRETPMAGRTHLQHALPITFGYKCALWMQPLLRSAEALRRAPLAVQFGGAVGTLASLGADGPAVAAALAEELGLPPAPPWHVDRSRFAEIVCALGVLCGGLAKMATDIAFLMQTEIAEVAEPRQPGRGGSSTMPQKRNPIACEYVLAAARGVHAAVPLMLGAMAQDHERATGPWQAEALALPQAFVLTSGALAHAVALAEGLVVDEARMRANLELTNGLVMAEAAMMALAPELGREQAHHLVQAACDRALANRTTLQAELAPHNPGPLDPAAYLGQAAALVDATLAAAAKIGVRHHFPENGV